jgi:hypothetical protein
MYKYLHESFPFDDKTLRLLVALTIKYPLSFFEDLYFSEHIIFLKTNLLMFLICELDPPLVNEVH